MWHASWSSVTSVKTGSMEGRLIFRLNCIDHIVVRWQTQLKYNVEAIMMWLSVVPVVCFLWLQSVLDPSQFFIWYKNVFCVAVLEWRRTKLLRLTCITAPTVRSLMGHLSVSYRSFSIPSFNCYDFSGLLLHNSTSQSVFSDPPFFSAQTPWSQ